MTTQKRSRPHIDLSKCKLSELPTDTLSVESPYDVLYRMLELLPDYYSSKNPKEQRLPEGLIVNIISEARAIVSKEPVLVDIDSPVYVCGDIHGQYYDLINIFHLCPPLGGKVLNPQKVKRREGNDREVEYNFLFLGDYVDRGSRSIEVMVTLMALKIISPSKMTLLRGNHEDEQIMVVYGFFDECKRRYNFRLFKYFCDFFKVLPVAALINQSIFCVHGGISSELHRVTDVPDVRPSNISSSGVLCDLLWADPEENMPYDCDWAPSLRGISYVFSERVLEKFLIDNDLSFVCRAHQVVEEGYKFFPNNKKRHLLTIFSATNYCNEFGNRGGILKVDENGVCSVIVLQPPSAAQQWDIKNFKDPINAKEN